jgi:uncharacterized protein
MTDPTSSNGAAPPPWKPLEARERRVLGVLIEKAKTTPAAYPITVNAIVAGCNQKNNRVPITAYDDLDVEKALDVLRTLGVVSEIDWLGRVSKYKHHAYQWLGVNPVELAVMAELLLRGAQTLGDLRGRAARMEPIADLPALKPIVDGLLDRGLMIELTPPGRGQIVSHHLYTVQELADLWSRHSGRTADEPAHDRQRHSSGALNMTPAGEHEAASSLRAARENDVTPGAAEPIAALTTEVAELRAEVARLRERVRDLEGRFAP